MTHDELQALLDSTPLLMGVAWGVIIPALISAMGLLKGGGGSSPDASAMMTPEMREMLDMQRLRMQQQQPLYNDVMGMARSLLPTRYRGVTPPRLQRPVPGPGAHGGAGGSGGGAGMGSVQGVDEDPLDGGRNRPSRW